MPDASRWALAALLLAACGDDGGATPDAAPRDAAPVDAPIAPPADARADAAPPPDAVPGTSCAAALPLEPGALHAGSTLGHPSAEVASCSIGTGEGRESFYRVDVGDEPADLLVRVTVDESAPPHFDAVVSVRSDCAALESELACSDSGWGERLELLEASGPHWVLVDGTEQYGGLDFGHYLLSVDRRELVGEGASCDPEARASRCAAGTRCRAGVCDADDAALFCADAIDLTPNLADGQTELTGVTHAFAADYFQAGCAAEPGGGFGEALYRFDLAAPMALVARTDLPGTDFDTVLSLRGASCDGAELACADDVDLTGGVLASRLEATLPAGRYYLVVDGSSASPGTGSFRLRVELSPAP